MSNAEWIPKSWPLAEISEEVSQQEVNTFQMHVALVRVVVTGSVWPLRSCQPPEEGHPLNTPSQRTRGEVLTTAGDLLFEAVALSIEVFLWRRFYIDVCMCSLPCCILKINSGWYLQGDFHLYLKN